MTLREAMTTLDSVIPPPQNRMVDSDHLAIAVAWVEVKKALLTAETTAERYDTLMKYRDNQVEAIRRRIDAGTLTTEDRRLLDELCLPHRYDKRDIKPFYFTFGSDPGFPYQNTYLIVLADTEKNAVAKFREKYPDRHTGTVNCAFWYSEEKWHGSPNEAEYGDPVEVIA